MKREVTSRKLIISQLITKTLITYCKERRIQDTHHPPLVLVSTVQGEPTSTDQVMLVMGMIVELNAVVWRYLSGRSELLTCKVAFVFVWKVARLLALVNPLNKVLSSKAQCCLELLPCLFDCSHPGPVVVDEQQNTFAVENLTRRICDSVKQNDIPSGGSRSSLQSMPNSLELDPDAITNLENYAKAISTSVDVMLRDLRSSLKGMADLTVKATECFTDAISASCNSVDATIKNTYALLAKVEEVNEAMIGIRKLSQQVKDIKRVVDLFETQLVTGSMT
uniref:BLOC-1-related complex subunit 6 C-terminal helix domain-containing protein n=1 Tax=Setaria digitata TaxID=48799 RepID=A0A915PS08_9BILA